MNVVKLLTLLLLILLLVPACSQETIPNVNQNAWESDLNYLVKLLKEYHPNPYWLNGEEGHDHLIEKARQAIQQEFKQEGFEEKILTQFSQIIAYLGDGHTYVRNRFEKLGRLPFTAYPFKEGIFILRTTEDHKEILGAKITHIDGTPIGEVLTKLKTTIPAANPSGIERNIFRYLNVPGLLYGLGISEHKDQVKITLNTVKEKAIERIFHRLKTEENPNYISAREALDIPTPMFLKKPGRNYWFEYDPSTKTLFFKFNRERNDEEEKFKKFRKRLFQFVDENPIEKFIIDLRHNGGGNGTIQCSIMEDIIARPKINQKGKLFVFTSDWTYSAAIILATNLETKTKALFVGEAPGDSPNHIGDNEPFTLPTSGLTFELSPFVWMNTYFFDDRKMLTPDLPIDYTFESYLKGRDLYLEAIQNYQTQPFPQKVDLDLLKPHLGRYQFSPGDILKLYQKEDRLIVEVPGRILTELYATDTSYYKTDMKGMKIEFPNKQSIRITTPEEASKTFNRLPDDQKVAIEYILENNYKQALEAYQQLKSEHPSTITLSGNNLIMQAYNLARMTGNWKIGLKLMRVNTKINPKSWLAHGELAQMRVWQGKYLGAIGPGLKNKRMSHYDVYEIPAAFR